MKYIALVLTIVSIMFSQEFYSARTFVENYTTVSLQYDETVEVYMVKRLDSDLGHGNFEAVEYYVVIGELPEQRADLMLTKLSQSEFENIIGESRLYKYLKKAGIVQ